MAKGIIELGWGIFCRELAITMNFRSDVALAAAKKASDHHKAWTMLRIARMSLTRELIVPFVRKQMEMHGTDYSPSAFMKFIIKATDPNYTFMCDYVFELLDSIFMFRTGVRGSIQRFIKAGLAKFAKLWCGRHHPLYRELEAAHNLQYERMPEKVRELVDKAASINLSGKLFTAEGADFRLEEINKKIQGWLPNIPSAQDWKHACCNFDPLTVLRNDVWNDIGIKDPKLRESNNTQEITDEVNAFRTRLRSQNYLTQPMSERAHISLSGEVLDADLKNFCKISRSLRADFIDKYMEYEKQAAERKPHSPSHKIVPVFVNSRERNHYTAIENKTVPELKELIRTNIRQINDAELRESLEIACREIIE